MSRVTVLYTVTHKQTGRRYVGITAQRPPVRRFRKHVSDAKRGSQTHFHRALSLYGEEAFEFRVEIEFESRDEANVAEIDWIATGPSEYNDAPGGGSCEGTKRSPEVCAKLSAVRIGMKFSPEHRARIGDVQRGVCKPTRTAQHAANLSASLTGHVVTEETRKKLSLQLSGRVGHPTSEETKAKLRVANLGRKPPELSPEARAQISAKLKGIVRSPETRAKMSAARRARVGVSNV
jgi:GIY-YIG catalytic domain-containing protein/NUMOD3 motif-containing protein